MLIDTHCHLSAPEFGGQYAKILHAAEAAGVSELVVPAVERREFAAVRELCERYPACRPAYGIHPIFVESASEDDLAALRATLSDGQAVAVGEIGLDFFIEHHDKERQAHFLVAQLGLAREFDLPVLLHTRRAVDATLALLRRHKVRGGIAHAFSGSAQQAAEFIKLGFKLGFGGAMTYPRATRLRELARTLPLSCIVLETDAPDMAPEFVPPGDPNLPEYLPRIAQTLASLRGLPPDEIARITTDNALAVLPLTELAT